MLRSTSITPGWREVCATSSENMSLQSPHRYGHGKGAACKAQTPGITPLKGAQWQTPLPGGICPPLGRSLPGLHCSKMFWDWLGQSKALQHQCMSLFSGKDLPVTCVSSRMCLAFYEESVCHAKHSGGLNTTSEALLLSTGDFCVQSISRFVRLRGGGNSR